MGAHGHYSFYRKLYGSDSILLLLKKPKNKDVDADNIKAPCRKEI